MSVTKEFQCSEALSSVVIIATWKLFFKVVLGLNKKKKNCLGPDSRSLN